MIETKKYYTEEDMIMLDMEMNFIPLTFDKLFKGIHDENFRPTVSALCHWCEYNPLNNPNILNTKPQAVCPYFSTWQKSGDNVRDTLCKWEGLNMVPIDRQFCISQLKQQGLVQN